MCRPDGTRKDGIILFPEINFGVTISVKPTAFSKRQCRTTYFDFINIHFNIFTKYSIYEIFFYLDSL